MKKIFTLLGGMLLASSLSVNAMEVEVSIYDDDTDKAAGDSYVTNLTKDSDGNFVLENFLGTIKSPVTLSFKFEKPSEINGYSGITVTSDYYIYDEKYADLFYLGKDEDNAPDMFINNYNNGGKKLWFCNPYIYNTARYTYVMALDKDEYGYDYYANICLSADYVYDYAISNYLNDTPYFDICFYFNDPSEANQEAYDDVIAQLNAVESEYNAAVEAIKYADPDWDVSYWGEIAKNIAMYKNGAAQELASANADLVDFFYPCDTEELESFIMEMKNKNREAYNQGAYDIVIKRADGLIAEYDEAVNEIREVNPDFNFEEEGYDYFPTMIEEIKTYAEKALAAADEDKTVFNYAFSEEAAEEYRGSIIDMKKAGFEEYNKKVYENGLAVIEELKTEYKDAVNQIEEVNPDFKLDEWSEIEEKISDAESQINKGYQGATENGEIFNFAYTGEDVLAYIIEMKNAAFFSHNQVALDDVLKEISAVRDEYYAARNNIEAQYPEFFNVTDWKNTIENAITEAMQGADQALAAALADGALYSYTFSKTDIENMIAEMEKQVPNFVAYEKVVSQIYALWKEFEDAKMQIIEVNESFDFEEWSDIILPKFDYAYKYAKVAFDDANELGEEYSYAFGGEDIRIDITEMKKEAFEEPNQKAYEATIEKINALIKEYDAAVTEIKTSNPEFDFTEWVGIGTGLEDTKVQADNALASANEDGDYFGDIFAFTDEAVAEIQAQIAAMKEAAKTTGISNIEAEVAAGNAKIFTLDGKSHNALVKGQVNVIVKKNSTMRVMVNK